MKNKKWGILLAVFSVVCMLAMSLTGFASGPLDGQKVEGSLLTSNVYAEDTRELVPENGESDGISTYGTYLSYGTASIKNLGGGQVQFYGDTVCVRQSDVVKANCHLQQLVNGVWSDYTIRYCTEYNTSYASAVHYATVPTGYYYRVKGTHSATKGTVVESVTTYTDGVYIG